MTNSGSAENRANSNGHCPASSPDRSSDTNSSPNENPTPSANPTVPGSMAGLPAPLESMPAIPPIKPTAITAATMPAMASGDGRSPVATPTATGTVAATSPVTGATTVMLPRANATYRPMTPTLLVTPAANPHQIARDVGPSDSISGTMTMHNANTTNSAISATAVAGERRLARPPM